MMKADTGQRMSGLLVTHLAEKMHDRSSIMGTILPCSEKISICFGKMNVVITVILS